MSSRTQFVVKVLGTSINGKQFAEWYDGNDLVSDIDAAYHYSDKDEAEKGAEIVRSDFDIDAENVTVQEREV